MVEVGSDGVGAVSHAAEMDVSLVEQQLARLEQAAAPRPFRLAWPLLVVGVLVGLVCVGHAFTAYSAIGRIDQNAQLTTANPIVLFQDVATNGPRVSPAIDSSSRGTYTRALNQYVLDGIGVCFGVLLAAAGAFVRLNR